VKRATPVAVSDGELVNRDPDCAMSRNTLALIRNAGIEPHAVEYLTPEPGDASNS